MACEAGIDRLQNKINGSQAEQSANVGGAGGLLVC